MKRRHFAAACGLALAAATAPLAAQVQVRLGEPGRANYSELHEGLKAGSPAADTVRALLRSRNTRLLWARVTAAVNGEGSWNDALLAMTRLALLRSPQVADSALRIRRFFERSGPYPFPKNPGVTSQDLEPSVQAILLERRRAVSGDSAVLADILARIATTTTATPGFWDGSAPAPRTRSSIASRRPIRWSSGSAISPCCRISPIPR
jgi:hypothetical protein